MLMATAMLFLESPRWLVSKGLEEDARSALIALSGKEDATDDTITLEFNAITSIAQQTATLKRGFSGPLQAPTLNAFSTACALPLASISAHK
jgi:hypothetical protein